MDRIGDGYDVVVIGGGAAGLAGATALLRSRRSVLVVDAGDPRNASAGHVHNFLTRDGTRPAELYAAGRSEVERYGGVVIHTCVDALEPDGDAFRVYFDGAIVTARRLLVATGSRDELPEIAGLAKRWGTDVLHCPYCHGWEVRDQRVGVLATGPLAAHQALLFRQLTATVTVLGHAGPPPTPEQGEQLAALGIPVVIGEVVEVTAADDRLTGVLLADGTHVELDALVVAPLCRARAELLTPLGLVPSEVRVGEYVIGTQIEADPTGATAVPGVWVAGNVSDMQAQVISSAAAGLTAAAAINMDLITADATAKISADVVGARHRHGAAFVDSPEAWDERYADSEQVWSGQPNGALTAEVSDLSPARVLDIGCGEGADAVWLAQRGWQVTGLDVSRVALERAERHAREAGVTVEWLESALVGAPLEPGSFELVSAQYPALLRTDTGDAERILIDLVAPGGMLLIVHHTRIDTARAREHGIDPDDYVSPADVAALLGDHWQIEVNETRDRHVSGGAGAQHVQDMVLRARRR